MVRRPRFSLATWSLLALVAGLALGMLGHGSAVAGFRTVERVVTPIGAVWLAALQMLLLPLIVSQILAAITGAGEGAGREVGKLGVRTIALFVLMLFVAGALTFVISKPIVSLYQAGPSFTASVAGDAVAKDAAASQSFAKQLPTNLIEAARKGQIFPILLFAALLGAAVTRLPDEKRIPLAGLFRGFADAMMIVVRWVLVFTPAGVFALTYASALDAGGAVAGMMGAFIVIVCAMLALFIVLLYPITAIAAKIPMRTFAKAVAPAQLVAVSTLSSIAALPALVQGGVEHLRLPPRFTGFVLPLCVSVFKMNRTISSTTKLVFLAHVYGVPLSVSSVVVFMISVTLLSFGAAGVPGGGQAFTTLPAYVAAGLPIEGVILLEATSMVPDMLKTIVNVTGDMSVAAILSRSSRGSEVVAPDGVMDDDRILGEGVA
ncbi:MAG TPA: cation:dicarboxylase symporter family transporter [Thermoanaerobaculia bacterium]|nr:cation:dicarboxylase symporter family transporter [Thermoanaerobaculia bacterium]